VIEERAAAHGVSPGYAVAIANCESNLVWDAVGDYGRSFGVYQLHDAGLLPVFYAEGYTDPFNVYQSADFATAWIARHGAGAWSCSWYVR
jgi:hypothetical protein